MPDQNNNKNNQQINNTTQNNNQEILSNPDKNKVLKQLIQINNLKKSLSELDINKKYNMFGQVLGFSDEFTAINKLHEMASNNEFSRISKKESFHVLDSNSTKFDCKYNYTTRKLELFATPYIEENKKSTGIENNSTIKKMEPSRKVSEFTIKEIRSLNISDDFSKFKMITKNYVDGAVIANQLDNNGRPDTHENSLIRKRLKSKEFIQLLKPGLENAEKDLQNIIKPFLKSRAEEQNKKIFSELREKQVNNIQNAIDEKVVLMKGGYNRCLTEKQRKSFFSALANETKMEKFLDKTDKDLSSKFKQNNIKISNIKNNITMLDDMAKKCNLSLPDTDLPKTKINKEQVLNVLGIRNNSISSNIKLSRLSTAFKSFADRVLSSRSEKNRNNSKSR